MFYRVVERAQFGDMASGRFDRSRLDSSSELPREEVRHLGAQQCLAVYALNPTTRPTAFPELLITRDGRERDWLAWLTAFSQTHRPFTAFCRVMGGEDAIRRFEAQRPDGPALGSIEGGCVGLILGEILSSEEVLGRLREPLPAAACASTLSFALARELALYRYSVGRGGIVDRWTTLRTLTKQRERVLDVGSIVNIVSILEAIGQGQKPADQFLPIAEVLEELRDGGFERAKRVFPTLMKFGINPEKDTREERVEKFEGALRASIEEEERHGAFVLGYLASRINPGTVMHAPLLAPALRRYPALMLWYGVCAGLSDPSMIVTALGGLGRRALRDVCARQQFLERPRADMSVEELEMFLQERPDDPPEFIVASASQLTVELDAGIWSTVNWSRRRRGSEERDAVGDRSWVLHELAPIVGRLAEVYNRLREQENRAVHARDNRDPRDREPAQGALPLDPTGKNDRPHRRRR